MMVTPLDNERLRLARLRALTVLDSGPTPLFDSLVQAAALAAGVPMAALNLIDDQRQWTKASVGFEGFEVGGARAYPRELDFCSHVVREEAIVEIADARLDARFTDHPAVMGGDGIRYYLGAPVILDGGLCIGALCVCDVHPRPFDEARRAALQALADAAAHALEQRSEAMMRESLLDRAGRLASVGGWMLDLVHRELVCTAETCRIHELPPAFRPTVDEALRLCPPDSRRRLQAAVAKARTEGTGWDIEMPMNTATGRKIWVRIIGSVETSDDGRPLRLVGAVQDISIRRKVISALEASERRFRALFQHSLGLICMHDHEGGLLSVNPAAARSLGYSVGELLGRPLTDLMKPERHAAFQDYLLRVITSGSDAGTLELIAKNGTRRVWQYQNVLDDEADEPYILGHAQDITERFENERTLRDWSQRDALTGCFNRRFLVERAAEEGMRWGCITVDLDHFKQVNDTYGHQRGDQVLIAMARFLNRFVRSEDAVVRLGGDEFLLLLRDAGPDETSRVTGRIEAERAQAPIAFTLGVASFGADTPLEQTLAEADRQLYRTRAADRGERPGREPGPR